MTNSLQNQLFKKYPGLFKQRKFPTSQSNMWCGADTDDGWYTLLDSVCNWLNWNITHNKYPKVEFTQVKEKFGTLRLYYTIKGNKKGKDDKKEETEDFIRRCGEIEGVISFAESLSGSICEVCGNPGKLTNEGWMRTECDLCRAKRRGDKATMFAKGAYKK
jgi:hypothetical protein